MSVVLCPRLTSSIERHRDSNFTYSGVDDEDDIVGGLPEELMIIILY